MPSNPLGPGLPSAAALNALTERLTSSAGRSLSPLMSSKFASSLSVLASPSLIAAASAYCAPAPPPPLPVMQFSPRHQKVIPEEGAQEGDAIHRCPYGLQWLRADEHDDVRSAAISEDEMDGFVADLGEVMRREFDCWVEQCWTESFHYLFTRTIPILVLHLILTGASPQFLRRDIIHGGHRLDTMFQLSMLDMMYAELELRLSGARPPELTKSPVTGAPNPMLPIPMAPPAPVPGSGGAGNASTAPSTPPRDGVCFHTTSYDHAVPIEEDDHGACICQLTSCLQCFQVAAINRKGATSLLPYELRNEMVSEGWTGQIETEAQARIRIQGLPYHPPTTQKLPEGKGFVQHAKSPGPAYRNGPPLFQHPQMTDVLAVEEHIRWRLKEMGAHDPAVEGRYGPCTNAPAALEGLDLSSLGLGSGASMGVGGEDGDEGDDQSTTSGPGAGNTNDSTATATANKKKVVKVTKGKGKMRRAVNAQQGQVPPKSKSSTNHANGKDDKKAGDKGAGKETTCYLPKEWAEAEPGARNMAVTLTFRHFVRLLHQIATSVTPFSYPSYVEDIYELERVHPVAMYRRLAEPAAQRSKNGRDARIWMECMDKWAEELGVREKMRGNMLVNNSRHSDAVEYYTRALALDPKKTIYLSNRAVALNTLGEHERAEADCTYILSKDGKNGKAFFQRALARRGMGRIREAESDLREVLRHQPGNESAKKLMSVVKVEVGRLPKLSAKEALEF